MEITEETLEVIIRESMSWIQFLSGLVPKLWVILIRETLITLECTEINLSN